MKREMKKTMAGTALLLALGMGFSGCAGVSRNYSFNHNQNQTSVVLSGDNYKVLKSIRGDVTNTYILGIGGLSRKAQTENAIGEMMKQAELEGHSRAVINVNVTEKRKTITPFYMQRTMTAEGLVIEFTGRQ